MAKSTRKKSETTIEDIHHEPVETQAPAAAATDPVVEDAVVVDDVKNLEVTIAREIKRFNLADAAIAELKNQYGALVINGVEDKDGYKAVKAAWQDVRSKRTGLEKKGLAIRNDYTAVTKAVKKEEDRLTDLIEPLENDLYQKWKAIDDLKEAEKKRKEQEEQDRLNKRIDEIMAAGCRFTDGYYGIGGTIAVDVATLRTMPDTQYSTLLDAVKNKAADLKAEADRLAAEKEKQDADRLAAQKKLDDDAAALKKQQDDFKRQQEEFENQKREMARQRREMRFDAFMSIGMTETVTGHLKYDNGFKSYSLTIEEVINEPDATFSNLLANARKAVEDCKQAMHEHEQQVERERIELENKKVVINDAMIPVGFSYNYNGYFIFANDFLTLKKTMSELLTIDEDDLKRQAAEWGNEIAAAKEKQDERTKQQEALKEQERLAGMNDAELLTDYLDRLWAVEKPSGLKTKSGVNLLGGFSSDFAYLVDDYRKKISTKTKPQEVSA